MALDVNPMANRRPLNIEPLTEKQLRDAERDKVYIYNTAPREHRIIVGKMWVIPACPEGADVSAPLVVPGIYYQTKIKKFDGLSKEFEWYGTDGIDIAKDIIGTAAFKDASENLARYGVFIAAGEVPTQDEIDRAREQWLARCDETVRKADQNYAVNSGMVTVNGVSSSNIGDSDRQAAKELGIVRPWSQKNPKMKICDQCGESNIPTAARCKNVECHAIFDEEKARKLFPQMFHVELEKRGPGRPRQEAVA